MKGNFKLLNNYVTQHGVLVRDFSCNVMNYLKLLKSDFDTYISILHQHQFVNKDVLDLQAISFNLVDDSIWEIVKACPHITPCSGREYKNTIQI